MEYKFQNFSVVIPVHNEEKIKETPVTVNEIRPSVYNISFDIPKTIFLIFKLRIQLMLEND
jgi:hypothetical protein